MIAPPTAKLCDKLWDRHSIYPHPNLREENPGMAYRLQYMLLADSVQPVQSGKLNVLGIFDQFYAAEIPTRMPGFVVVALLVAPTEDELGDHNVSLRILRPNNQPVGETAMRVNMAPQPGSFAITSARLVIGVANLPIREFGRHRLELLVDDQRVGEHPLVVVQGTLPGG